MKKIIFILLSITLFITNNYASYLQDGNYIVTYRFINYASSPTTGSYRYTLVVKNKELNTVLDLKRGITISPKNSYGLTLVMQLLTKDSKTAIATPYKIKQKNSPFVIYIDEIKRVSSNYSINPLQLRKDELSKNYRKWLNKKIAKYTIRIQDSRYSNIYKEGVELTIKNGTITKATDIRSLKQIDTNNPYFSTIKKLFGIAMWGIKDATIDYNYQYGYPSFIKLKNGITITSSYLQSL